MRKYRIEERIYGDNGESEFNPQYSDHIISGNDVWEGFTEWVGVGVIMKNCFTYDEALLVITKDKLSNTSITIKYHIIT